MKRTIIQVAAFAALAAVGCKGPGYNLPPMERLMAPGPGVDGPGPGVLSAADLSGPPSMGPMSGFAGEFEATPSPTVQVMFAKPEGMQVTWDMSGCGSFDSEPLVTPGRTNFNQAGLYRVKLQNISGHEGMELYPTLEIGPAKPRTLAYLAHNAIPLQLTVDDFNQVLAGNFVTKVIYLPDPDFQELAVAGVETLVSTRLDPGVNPIVEADRRGSILAVLRIGNKDIEMPGMEGDVGSFTGSLCESETGGMGGGMRGGMGGGPPMMGPGGVMRPPMGGGAPGYSMGPGGPIYGMPQTGTPIGLPGPPHIPLGGPAGLKKHSMFNHTHRYVPDPTMKIGIHVKQQPGVSYPTPRNKAYIHEYNPPRCSHCNGAGCQSCGPGH